MKKKLLTTLFVLLAYPTIVLGLCATDSSRFTDYAGEVTDHLTGLTWQRCALGVTTPDCADNSPAAFTWQQALQAATPPWRLPNISELRSLISSNCDVDAIDSLAFPNNPWGDFISSSPAGGDKVWSVRFRGAGWSFTVDKSGSYPVRLVKDTGASAHTVGGTVNGLAGSGLVLQNFLGDDLVISANGGFSFPTAILDTAPYSITVASHPNSPGQTCAVSNGTGLIVGANVTDIVIDCQTYPKLRQQAYVKASVNAQNKGFGSGVAISGDTMAIGSDDGTTVNIYTRFRKEWSLQATVTGSNTEPGDSFGYALALHGDTLVVGAYKEGSNATDVDGDGSNNLSLASGAAYVFVRTGTSWSEQAFLKASNPDSGDYFGFSIAVWGDYILVGAPYEDSDTTGVYSNNNNLAAEAGAAYLFKRSGTTWSPTAYIKASNTAAANYFGWSVANYGSTLVVSAPWEGTLSKGVNGDQTDNLPGRNAGAVYVFEPVLISSFAQTAYIKASNTRTQHGFGQDIAISGDTLVVGARGDRSGATGINGDQTDDSSPGSGAAFVFIRTNSSWEQQAYIKASNTDFADDFGLGVALDGDTLVVGARQEQSSATGVDGDQSDNSVTSGATYVFNRYGPAWSQQAYLKASNTDLGDLFGYPVAVSGTTVVIGAYGEDSNATGIDGDQSNNSIVNAGAVYVFDTEFYALAADVTGLLGTGLVLRNYSLEDLPVAFDGRHYFSRELYDFEVYDVTVLNQPVNPGQTCTVTDGSSSAQGSNVLVVNVNCVTDVLTVGGTVSGLSGSGLVLQNNAGDNLPISANGDFTFSTPVNEFDTYSVSVWSQPSSPDQTCTITNGTGTVYDVPVNNVLVSCQAGIINHNLQVNSSGVTGVNISSASGLGGVTNYSTPARAGTNVVLEAPATVGGYSVASWSGCTSTSGTICNVTISTDKTVEVQYVDPRGSCPAGTSPAVWRDDDMELGNRGWTRPNVVGNTWELNETTASSPTHAWHGLDSGTVSDQSLVSPTVVLPPGYTNAVLSFDNKRDIEYDTATTCYDGAVLEYSTDGTTWNPVESSNFLSDGYNASVIAASNPLYGREAWCGVQDWTRTEVNLYGLSEKNLNFRFRIGTDVSVDKDGWHMDDFKVSGCQSDAVTYNLQVNSSGATGVPITSPTSHDGTTAYSKNLSVGTDVILAAPASWAGYGFSSWSGCTGNLDTSCNVTMSAHTTVTANYAIPCYPLTLSHTDPGADPAGTDPDASPGYSAGCAEGSYHAGESISLTAYSFAGWAISSWTGTSNDATTASTIQLTMPAFNHAVTVHYVESQTCPTGSSERAWLDENMETGENGWTHFATLPANDKWLLGTATANSPTHSWHGGYGPDTTGVTDQSLVSKDVYVPTGVTNAVLSFYNKRDLASTAGAIDSCYDGAVLEYSTNGSTSGANWLPVEASRFLADGYNGLMDSNTNPLVIDRQAWCGVQDWTLTEVDLTGLDGETLNFRFRIGTDQFDDINDGWHIDDVKIKGCVPPEPVDPVIFMNGFEN